MSTPVALTSNVVQAVVQRYFAASRSHNKVEAMIACFAEDCVCYDPAETPALQGKAQLRQFLQGIAGIFETIELVEEFISINGNEAAVKWIGTGIGLNGRSITFEGIDLFEVNAEGKIQVMRGYWNPTAMATELLIAPGAA
ncbi:SnoaL-like polyketide cyclase [Leptolyngbyaceae cyanobacterium JSC-12]|nr:SnoaL-like polyketide cyclase [Leptolyngbyaceae cyanobacterium JSC-12]